jgi:hypothetical protein
MAGQSDDERVWVFEEGVIADWTGLAWLEGRFGDAVKGYLLFARFSSVRSAVL